MKRSRLSSAAAIGILFVAAAATSFVPEKSSTDDALDRYRKGRAVLQQAVEAIGGYPSVRSFTDMSFSFQAVAKARGQSASHNADFTDLPAAGEVVFESSGRLFFDYVTELRGGRALKMQRVVDNSSGWTYRVIENELSEMSAFDLGFLKSNPGLYPIDAIPHSLILTALGNPSSIRIGGKSTDEEGTASVEFSSKSGSVRTLVIDSDTGLPIRVEYLTSDPLLGDTYGAVRFDEYRNVDGIRIPHRLSFSIGGEDLGHWTISEVSLNTSPSDDVFARPDVEVTQSAPSYQPVKLADGVYAVRLYSGMGFTYNTMLVEFDDYVAVVEAPLSDFFYGLVSGIAAKIAPGKPIKYVVSTHYHFDHTNGIKAYLANGATVLTVKDNVEYIASAALADHSLLPNPLKGYQGTLSIESIGKERTIGSGNRKMRLIDVGPNPHVDQILVAYLPQEKILFVSDLISTFDGGYAGDPTNALIAFDARLTDLGLDVETFVPGHGPTISRSEFKSVVEKAL